MRSPFAKQVYPEEHRRHCGCYECPLGDFWDSASIVKAGGLGECVAKMPRNDNPDDKDPDNGSLALGNFLRHLRERHPDVRVLNNRPSRLAQLLGLVVRP